MSVMAAADTTYTPQKPSAQASSQAPRPPAEVEATPARQATSLKKIDGKVMAIIPKSLADPRGAGGGSLFNGGELVLGSETFKVKNVAGKVMALLPKRMLSSLSDVSPAGASPPARDEPPEKLARPAATEADRAFVEPMDCDETESRPAPETVSAATPRTADSRRTAHDEARRTLVRLLHRRKIGADDTHEVNRSRDVNTRDASTETADDNADGVNRTRAPNNRDDSSETCYDNRTETTARDNTFQSIGSNRDRGNNIGGNSPRPMNVNALAPGFFANLKNVNLARYTIRQAYQDYLGCVRREEIMGNMPIHQAALADDVNALEMQCHLLAARKVSVDVKNFCGLTALHLAINKGHARSATLLRNFKARLDETDRGGNTALHLAVKNVRHGCLASLLLPAQNAPGEVVPIDKFNDNGLTPLHLSCIYNKLHDCTVLLQYKADPNLKDMHSGRTALFFAVEHERPDLVRELLKAKANPSASNYAGHSVWSLVTEGSGDARVRRMLEQQVAATAKKTTQRRRGRTVEPPAAAAQ